MYNSRIGGAGAVLNNATQFNANATNVNSTSKEIQESLSKNPLSKNTGDQEIKGLVAKLQCDFKENRENSEEIARRALGPAPSFSYEIYMQTENSCFQLLKNALEKVPEEELGDVLVKVIKATDECEESPCLVYELVKPCFEKFKGVNLAELLLAGYSQQLWLTNSSIKKDWLTETGTRYFAEIITDSTVPHELTDELCKKINYQLEKEEAGAETILPDAENSRTITEKFKELMSFFGV